MFNLFERFKNRSKQDALPATILVVEDNEVDRSLIVRTLEKEQYQVIAAVDGEEGLKKARENKADLILLDYHLPGINGIDICEALKKDSHVKQVPIIFLTTVDGGDIVHFYEAGAEFYLHKPIEPKVLLREVRLMLQEARGKK